MNVCFKNSIKSIHSTCKFLFWSRLIMTQSTQLSGFEKYANWSKEELIVKLLGYENQQIDNDQIVNEQISNDQIVNEDNDSTNRTEVNVAKKQNSIPKKKKSPRPFDMSKYSKRRIALKVAYFGWNYHGFETNVPNEKRRPTIEGQLFSALMKAKMISDPSECNFTKCGRTDKGVSSLGQVVAFNVRSNLPHDSSEVLPSRNVESNVETNVEFSVETNVEFSVETNVESNVETNVESTTDIETNDVKTKIEEIPFVESINNLLPDDIRIIAWAPVNPDFSARFDCRYRHYKYFFVKGNLDIDLMRDAANRFLGTHDFRNFCKLDPSKQIKNFDRIILKVGIEKVQQSSFFSSQFSGTKEFYEFNLIANAFLWHQVRCMMAILFLVGQKLEPPSIIDNLLDITKTPAKPNYEMANELPLILYDCKYDNIINWQFGRDKDKMFNMPIRIYKHIYEQWNIHMTKALIFSTFLNDFGNISLKQLKPNDQEINEIQEINEMQEINEIKEMVNDEKNELSKNQNLNMTLDEFVFSNIDTKKYIITGGGKEAKTRNYIKIEKRQTNEPVEIRNEKYKAKKIKLEQS
ncbi:hypothetical protein Glove_460g46 [Diversispora epigaea]|uniref:Pseudouridine synthase I TruA alpha/beta domain-containing protein n=1 Tax=Diversispora epigaea TaxID=1348612 RepID=A0A397GPW2_9GLOM|nr:hypothetical protein Glove_460g46 [Diversispora epigaea]